VGRREEVKKKGKRKPSFFIVLARCEKGRGRGEKGKKKGVKKKGAYTFYFFSHLLQTRDRKEKERAIVFGSRVANEEQEEKKKGKEGKSSWRLVP